MPDTTKTLEEWFRTLPEPLQSQAISNALNAGCNIQITCAGSLVEAIDRGFIWSETPEGDVYWESVCDRIELDVIDLLDIYPIALDVPHKSITILNYENAPVDIRALNPESEVGDWVAFVNKDRMNDWSRIKSSLIVDKESTHKDYTDITIFFGRYE